MKARFEQGHIVKLPGYSNEFLVVSSDDFIEETGLIHVCPIFEDLPFSNRHIPIDEDAPKAKVAVCERLELIDPEKQQPKITGRLSYPVVLTVSDVLKEIFQYS